MRLRWVIAGIWLLGVPLLLLLNFHQLPPPDGHRGAEPADRAAAAPPRRIRGALEAAAARDGEQRVGGAGAAHSPKAAPARPCDFSEGCVPGPPEAGGPNCCWELRNSRLRVAIASHNHPQWVAFEDLRAPPGSPGLPLHTSPLFQLVPESPPGAEQPDFVACVATSATRPGPLELRLALDCSHGVRASFAARLGGEAAHYLRVQVQIWSARPAVGDQRWPAKGFRVLRLFELVGTSRVEETGLDHAAKQRFELDPVDGLPLVVGGGRFFVGVEHPMAVHGPAGASNRTHWAAAAGQVMHLAQLPEPSEASPWSYGAVFGAISEPSQARRDFVAYLHAERPGRRSPMVHYNSWYDFYSYQDEGFNGGFKDIVKDPELIGTLRPDRLNETACVLRVEAFGRELVERRRTTIDSFLWDDGWDDPESLWQFDQQRFPRRFDAVAAKARSYGAGTGVWLSPWGGYGFPQEARVKFGKKHGWETNWNQNMEVEAFSLAGSHYRKAFRDVALSFVREQGVNMFKFDGVAGNPKELAVEMEAMLALISDLRAATGRGASKAKGGGGGAGNQSEEEIWINLTTGTWASPFFLLWADSIWRGGPDIASRRRDWEPDYGFGRSDGLTRRQRWIRWRNLIVYLLVVVRSKFFPLSQLMIHGVVLASHGDALHWGLDKFDAVDFAQEVWSFVGLGLQLQELYVASRHMTSEAWDILAEGLRWSRREAAVLRDSHWAFGDPTSREVYAVACWEPATLRGFVMLHNPTGSSLPSAAFRLGDVLELPEAQQTLHLSVALVKSISRPERLPRRGGGAAPAGRLPGWPCAELPTLSPDSAGRPPPPSNCTLPAASAVRVVMLPTEVLVLAVHHASLSLLA